MVQNTRPLFTLGAFAIIFDDEGRVLLCHRCDMDVWNLPGGGMEPGELPDEAVIREVKEETGLEVVVDRLAGVYGKPGRNDLVFSFICRVTGGLLSTSSESDANEYYHLDEMPANTLLKHAERVWDAANGWKKPIFRRQVNLRNS